jgi:nicotinamide mononucleotide adenylyltransferase
MKGKINTDTIHVAIDLEAVIFILFFYTASKLVNKLGSLLNTQFEKLDPNIVFRNRFSGTRIVQLMFIVSQKVVLQPAQFANVKRRVVQCKNSPFYATLLQHAKNPKD